MSRTRKEDTLQKTTLYDDGLKEAGQPEHDELDGLGIRPGWPSWRDYSGSEPMTA